MWLGLLAGLAVYTLFGLVPMAGNVIISFTDYTALPNAPVHNIGWANYSSMFSSNAPGFDQGVVATLVFVLDRTGSIRGGSCMEVHRSGRPVTLTRLQFKLLQYFILNPTKVISRDELLNEVWGLNNYPCTRTVDTHVHKLRQQLEADPASPVHFHTVHAAGYKFVP